MAKVYLAWSSAGVATLQKHSTDRAVNLLVSYAIWDQYLKTAQDLNVQNLIMDSGAFSVFNSGKTIDITQFIRTAKASGAKEVFALDDILDYRKSQHNTARIWAAGVPAIPVYHAGEPRTYLDWCCKYTPCAKIALACKSKRQGEWLKAQFKYIWDTYGPMKIHGLAMSSTKLLNLVPFDSVDASSWATAPGRFGQYAGFTGKQMHLKSKMRSGVDSDLWVEVVEHQRREDYSEFIWRHELVKMPNRDAKFIDVSKVKAQTNGN